MKLYHYRHKEGMILLLLIIFALGVASEIRIVDGRAYNIRRSTNWHAVGGTIEIGGTNTVFVKEYVLRRERFGANGEYNLRKEFTGGLIAIRNKGGDAGDDIFRLMAMRVGNTNYDGKVWKLYDAGTLPTNHSGTPKTATPANRKKPAP